MSEQKKFDYTKNTIQSIEVTGTRRSVYPGMVIELAVTKYTAANIHTESKPTVYISPANAFERRSNKIVWNQSNKRRSVMAEANSWIITTEIWKNKETGELTRKEITHE